MDFEIINLDPQYLEKHNLVVESQEGDDYQIVSEQLHNTNRTGQGASQGYYIVALHTFILALIAIFGVCIQLKFPNVSPYATAYGTRLMNAFTIETSIYIVSLVVMTISAGRNCADLEDFMNKVCLLCGSLPLSLELLVLIKPFGWFILFVWNICLVWFVCKYRRLLLTLYNNAVIHLVQATAEFRQTLIEWNRVSIITNDEAENDMSITNGERAIQLQSQNVNIRNDKRATEHQPQDQKRTSVTEHAISIPDES